MENQNQPSNVNQLSVKTKFKIWYLLIVNCTHTTPFDNAPVLGLSRNNSKKMKHQKLNVMFIVSFNRVCGDLLLKLECKYNGNKKKHCMCSI